MNAGKASRRFMAAVKLANSWSCTSMATPSVSFSMAAMGSAIIR